MPHDEMQSFRIYFSHKPAPLTKTACFPKIRRLSFSKIDFLFQEDGREKFVDLNYGISEIWIFSILLDASLKIISS